MRSNNPIFNRTPGFNGQAAANPYAAGPTVIEGQIVDGAYAPHVPAERMTMDSVVQSAAITLGVVLVTAGLTWGLTPSIDSQGIASSLIAAVTVGSLAAFALSMVNSFKRVVSPALVLAFAAAEGVTLGALSKIFDTAYGSGVVSGAVLGTFGAFAGTLAAYKFFNIKVGQKFQMMVMAGMFGMIGLGMMSMILSLFGVETGLFGFGALGLLTAVAGLALGVFMLILDFDLVEQGIRNGVDSRESWRAAFALTVSLVWIYTNLLRLLAILNSD